MFSLENLWTDNFLVSLLSLVALSLVKCRCQTFLQIQLLSMTIVFASCCKLNVCLKQKRTGPIFGYFLKKLQDRFKESFIISLWSLDKWNMWFYIFQVFPTWSIMTHNALAHSTKTVGGALYLAGVFIHDILRVQVWLSLFFSKTDVPIQDIGFLKPFHLASNEMPTSQVSSTTPHSHLQVSKVPAHFTSLCTSSSLMKTLKALFLFALISQRELSRDWNKKSITTLCGKI